MEIRYNFNNGTLHVEAKWLPDYYGKVHQIPYVEHRQGKSAFIFRIHKLCQGEPIANQSALFYTEEECVQAAKERLREMENTHNMDKKRWENEQHQIEEKRYTALFDDAGEAYHAIEFHNLHRCPDDIPHIQAVESLNVPGKWIVRHTAFFDASWLIRPVPGFLTTNGTFSPHFLIEDRTKI